MMACLLVVGTSSKVGRSVLCCSRVFHSKGVTSSRFIRTATGVESRKEALGSPPEVLSQNTNLDAVSGSSGLTDIAPQTCMNGSQFVSMGDFGLGGWLPTDWTPYLFEVVYNHLHLPWWGCVASVAVLARLALLPWWMKHRIKAQSVALVSEAIEPINERMEEAKQANDMQAMAAASSEMTRLYKKHNVSPFTMFTFPVMQGVLYVYILWGLKDVLMASVTGLEAGGTLWFSNLMVPDPYYVLPVLTGVGLLTNIQLGDGTFMKQNEFSQKVKFMTSVASIVAIPLFATLPSGLLLYAVTSSFCTFIQLLVFKYSPAHQYLTPNEMKRSKEEHPDKQ